MSLTDADATAPDQSSPWLQGQYAPVDDELEVDGLAVTGHLPEGLRGAHLRNGPNPAFPPLGRYHIFDGDGMVHGLWLDGEGGARYANRWVRSAGLEAERAAGAALFGGLSDFRLPPDDVLATVGPLKNTANTHVVGHAGRILALLEAAPPTELAADLSTIGEHDFGGALKGPMTAHPKVDPITGEMVFFGYSPFPPHLRVHAADAAGHLTWTTEVELPAPVMMHDFVVTATRVVIFDLPAAFELDALLAGGEGIRWAPERGARIGVLDRGAPGDTTTWIDVDPFWAFHFLNGHDDGDAIVAEGCRSDRLNVAFGEEAPDAPPPTLHRWRIDPASGTVSDEPLDDRPTDFPRIDDRRAGLDARYGYTCHTRALGDDEVEFDGVTKHDLRTGTATTATFGADTRSGEAVFAADPDRTDEDAGWLMSWVHDRGRDESAVVVLDAETLDEVARVHLPRRVPSGFHGSFLPTAD
ncbi:carotenoid oxygenase family protein [soil metagenome]